MEWATQTLPTSPLLWRLILILAVFSYPMSTVAVERVKDLSGWSGDMTKNATDKKPSIGEDDYKTIWTRSTL